MPFLGFRILPGELRVKRASVERAKARLREKLAAARADPTRWEAFAASLRATFAHWAHGDTWRLREETLHELGVHPDDPWVDGETRAVLVPRRRSDEMNQGKENR